MESQTKPFFYRSNVQKWCGRILLFFCIAPVIFEFLFVKRYSHFAKNGFQSIDGMVSFYGLVGFLGALIFVLIAKIVGYLIRVGETYYNDDY